MQLEEGAYREYVTDEQRSRPPKATGKLDRLFIYRALGRFFNFNFFAITRINNFIEKFFVVGCNSGQF